MDFTAPTHDPPNSPRAALRRCPGTVPKAVVPGIGLPGPDTIEDLQLRRLAGAVLNKSMDDMAALSQSNPDLFWEWIEAFALKRREAESDCRMWSAAIACLATTGAAPNPSVRARTAAE